MDKPKGTIEDFIFSINDLKNANNLELFFAFYNSYKANIPDGHSIERCYNWAPKLLEDFNEIDKAYVNHIGHRLQLCHNI